MGPRFPLTVRPAAGYPDWTMGGIISASSLPTVSSAGDTVGLTLLKKSQDLMSQQANALLATLPPPASSPNPPGVGGRVDLIA